MCHSVARGLPLQRFAARDRWIRACCSHLLQVCDSIEAPSTQYDAIVCRTKGALRWRPQGGIMRIEPRFVTSVLLVDDVPVLLNAWERELKRAGKHAAKATNRADAV